MKPFFSGIGGQLRSTLSRPLTPGPLVPRPTNAGRPAARSRSVHVSPSASAGTSAFGWLWRLVLGCGLALAMVLGSELLPAAPPAAAPRGTVSPAKSPAADASRDAAGPVALEESLPAEGESLPAEGDDTSATPKRLRLTGKLFVDPDRLSRVHSRFAGQVVELGRLDPESSAEESRPLRYGDAVRRNQLLATVWSREVGEKKSDLIHAMSQLAVDQAQYERLSALEKGLVSVSMLAECRRQYECDLIAVQRVRRTLRSWRLSEEEIGDVVAEAKRIQQKDRTGEALAAERWAKFEIRAPLDGVILEQNVTIGDLVGVGADLFKIADLSTLGVMASLYEEDLPLVESLPTGERRWTVYVAAHVEAAGIAGRFETIGSVVDPRQHTATVVGWVPNPSGALRAGQLIRAEIAPFDATNVAAAGGAKKLQAAIPVVRNATDLGQPD